MNSNNRVWDIEPAYKHVHSEHNDNNTDNLRTSRLNEWITWIQKEIKENKRKVNTIYKSIKKIYPEHLRGKYTAERKIKKLISLEERRQIRKPYTDSRKQS